MRTCMRNKDATRDDGLSAMLQKKPRRLIRRVFLSRPANETLYKCFFV